MSVDIFDFFHNIVFKLKLNHTSESKQYNIYDLDDNLVLSINLDSFGYVSFSFKSFNIDYISLQALYPVFSNITTFLSYKVILNGEVLYL